MKQFCYFVAITLLVTLSCKGQQFHTIAPTTFIAGKSYPFAVEVKSNDVLNQFYSGNIALSSVGGIIPNGQITIRKGRGMKTLQTEGNSTLSITANQFGVTPTQNQSDIAEHAGSTTGNLRFQSGSVHQITSDLIISQGDTLLIEAGCWVLLDEDVNIWVEGHFGVVGLASNPVAFSSNSSEAWGGIIVGNGTATFKYCLINNAGGDDSQWFGHSDSQPVVRSNGGLVNLNRTFIFDCVGKGIAALNGRLNFSNGGISRCDTGGEFGASYVRVSGSHITEIPDADGILSDDDNDGLYFFGANPNSEPNIIDSCVFVFGEDDGVDHNGAILHVLNSWIEGFANEGIAASNENSVYVYNSLFKDCEQGIEAGYGTPTVTVDHCVLVENDYGLRFGDWYNWGCNGTITCTNSIMFNNTDNVHNFDVLSNGPIANALTVTYSIPTDAEYDSEAGNLVGLPVFNSKYQLQAGSIGEGAATDGSNMGLVITTMTNIEIPAEVRGSLLETVVYNLQGQLIFQLNKPVSNMQLTNELGNGIYLIQCVYESGSTTKKLVVQK